MTKTEKFGTALTDSIEEARDLGRKLESAKVEGIRLTEIVDRRDPDFGRYSVMWLM